MNKRFRRRLKSKFKRKRKRRGQQRQVSKIQNIELKSEKQNTKIELEEKEVIGYEQKIRPFIDKGIIDAKDIYYYSNDNDYHEYESTFKFYQENLESQTRFNINNCIYYFHNDDSFNASAIKRKNHNLIRINKGLMVNMMNMFMKNPDLLNHTELREYGEFEEIMSNPHHILMYQNASHYVFYHELGHLIQFNGLRQKSLQEGLINNGDFDINRHIGEMDADEFAGISMAAHISQYFEYYQDEKDADRLFNHIVILVVSSIILYILSFPSNRVPLYFKEGTHPHPLIRTLNVASTIISHLKQMQRKLNLDQEIDHLEIFKKSLNVSHFIEVEQWGSNLCNMFYDNVENNYKEIMAYISELYEIRKENKETAVYKRNMFTKRIRSSKI